MHFFPSLITHKINYYLWKLYLQLLHTQYHHKYHSIPRLNYRHWDNISLMLAGAEWSTLNSIINTNTNTFNTIITLPLYYWFSSGLNHPAAYRSWNFGNRSFSPFDLLSLHQWYFYLFYFFFLRDLLFKIFFISFTLNFLYKETSL